MNRNVWLLKFSQFILEHMKEGRFLSSLLRILSHTNQCESFSPVNKLLAQYFLNDILVIVVAQGSAQLVIVHVRLVLPESPQASHLFCINQLKFAIIVSPGDNTCVLVTDKEFQQKLPQRNIRLHVTCKYSCARRHWRHCHIWCQGRKIWDSSLCVKFRSILLVFGMFWVQISAVTLAEICCNFPQFLQANAEIIFRMSSQPLNFKQFRFHYSPISYHAMVNSLNYL